MSVLGQKLLTNFFAMAMISTSASIANSEPSQIYAEVFKMPEHVELSSITTAGAYIISSHLVRPLVSLDRYAQIQPSLAKSWFSSKNKTVWTIKLNTEYFSNGDVISSEDVVLSIKRQLKIGTGVHFPFSEIKSVHALNPSTIVISLNNPRNDFIYDLAKPEFGVLHKTDYFAEKNNLSFKITSGPYCLEKQVGTKFYLNRNAYYQSDVENNYKLILDSSSGLDSAQRLAQNKISFFTTQQSISVEEHKKLLSGNSDVVSIKPHVGFTFWISLNPNSNIFKKLSDRLAFLSLIKKNEFTAIDGFFWERANQLYLPDGDGRPSDAEINLIWAKVLQKWLNRKFIKKVKLRVLPLKIDNVITEEIVFLLRQHFDVEILKYNTEDELNNIIRQNSFDIKFSSNDFSSSDLSENLKTTFNNSRPYVFIGNYKKYPELMKKISETEDRNIKCDLYKSLGISLIEDGLVAPVAYLRVYFYTKKNVDVAAWSNLYPEISFWKVRIGEKTK